MTDAATLSPPADRPAHIPDSAVYDFDLFQDAGLKADAHGRILELVQSAPPVFWTPHNGGHWMIVGHEQVFKASRDWETFTSEFVPQSQIQAMLAAMPPGSPHIPQPLPINIDPPAHTMYRAPLNAAFSPRSVMALKDSIRKLAGELIDAIKDKGAVEFMATVAEPLPVQVFLAMFGLPLERQVEYRQLVKEHLSEPNTDMAATMRRLQRTAAIMRDTMLDRKEHPKDDIISLLWQTEIGGKPTTLDDMENYAVVLFIAGLDTVMNGIGLGVRHLAMNPQTQAELRANPKLIPEAAEEILRRYTFTVPPRKVAKDTAFEGIAMKEGEKAFLFLPGADLDAHEYPDPEAFDLNRENKVHIAFGTGPHRCLGSHLARVELQVLYEELLARLPEFRLDPAHKVTFHGGHVIGPDELWLRWD